MQLNEMDSVSAQQLYVCRSWCKGVWTEQNNWHYGKPLIQDATSQDWKDTHTKIDCNTIETHQTMSVYAEHMWHQTGARQTRFEK